MNDRKGGLSFLFRSFEYSFGGPSIDSFIIWCNFICNLLCINRPVLAGLWIMDKTRWLKLVPWPSAKLLREIIWNCRSLILWGSLYSYGWARLSPLHYVGVGSDGDNGWSGRRFGGGRQWLCGCERKGWNCNLIKNKIAKKKKKIEMMCVLRK